MFSYAIQIASIICINLLAFLSLGHILDALFETDGRMKILFLILSIPALVLILGWKIQKIQRQLSDISPTHDHRNINPGPR